MQVILSAISSSKKEHRAIQSLHITGDLKADIEQMMITKFSVVTYQVGLIWWDVLLCPHSHKPIMVEKYL